MKNLFDAARVQEVTGRIAAADARVYAELGHDERGPDAGALLDWDGDGDRGTKTATDAGGSNAGADHQTIGVQE